MATAASRHVAAEREWAAALQLGHPVHSSDPAQFSPSDPTLRHRWPVATLGLELDGRAADLGRAAADTSVHGASLMSR
jgi:hypothetical protein